MWEEDVLTTYDNLVKSGKGTEDGLAVIGHQYISADIEISIDNEGNAVMAERLKKKNKDNKEEKGKEITLIPITKKSGGRTSGKDPCPHALNEQLEYLAADFPDYCEEDDKEKTPIAVSVEKKCRVYLENLSAWKEAETGIVKDILEAVFNYVKRGTITEDLLRFKVLKTDPKRKDKLKKDTRKEYVRFSVNLDGRIYNTWKCQELIEAWAKRFQSDVDSDETTSDSICMITGEKTEACKNHPKKIIAAEGNAKLISSNDKYNFTYRGRFTEASEALCVGNAASQKIHSTLGYLIKNNGFFAGKRQFILWRISGEPIEEDSLFEEDQPKFSDEYALKAEKIMAGKTEKEEFDDEIRFMGFEALTKGRVSITAYDRMSVSDYYKKSIDWHSRCREYRYYYKDQCWHVKADSPHPMKIILFAFGHESTEGMEANDSIKGKYMQMLQKCIIKGDSIPKEIVSNLVNNTAKISTYKKNTNKTELLYTASAVVRKYTSDQQGGKRTMIGLDETCTDRSYLYGRIAAIFKKIENAAGNNNTNIERRMQAFVRKPNTVFGEMMPRINPYMRKLNDGLHGYFENRLESIHAMIDKDSGFRDRPLDPQWVNGYYDELNFGKGRKE